MVILLAPLVALLFVLIEIRVLRYTFEALGIDRRYVASLLFLSLFGSYVNIPVARLAGPALVREHGIAYLLPAVHGAGTVIALNVGGCLIPVAVSLYLLAKNRLWTRGILATAVVAALIHPMAQPVAGVGISVPTFLPALMAVCVALALSRRYAAPLAYVGGSIGTLLGADLLNLGTVPAIGAPLTSIGGAGTFDGIFLTGVLAVMLAPWYPGNGGQELAVHGEAR